MNTTFKTFYSSVGDCIFLLLNSKKERFSIMVDCGDYDPSIQKFIHDTLNDVIDLLIVTHIDNDHIKGVTTMLSKNIKVNRIIFNSYERNNNEVQQNFNESQKKKLRAIGKKIGIVVEDIINSDGDPGILRGPKDAMLGLSATILEKPALKKVWNQKYTLNGTSVDLKEWGKLTFLSPTIDELDNLDKAFVKVLFDELNTDNALGQWDKQKELYEILLRYVELQETEQTPMKSSIIDENKAGAVTLEERLEKAAGKSVNTSQITAANQASLAFVWEKDGHRVLIMGDANPDIVVNGLEMHYKKETFPIIFDAIKVSHHGSHYNTTKDLIKHADSEHYFFTGGLEGKRPSEEAVGRIVLSPLPEGLQKRILHFNFQTSLVEELKNNKVMKGKYKFSVDTKKNELKFKL